MWVPLKQIPHQPAADYDLVFIRKPRGEICLSEENNTEANHRGGSKAFGLVFTTEAVARAMKTDKTNPFPCNRQSANEIQGFLMYEWSLVALGRKVDNRPILWI